MAKVTHDYDDERLVQALAFHGKVHVQQLVADGRVQVHVTQMGDGSAAFTISVQTDYLPKEVVTRVLNDARD